MSCKKVSFEDSRSAEVRSNEIYKETKKKIKLRSYKCDVCGKFHLTKMSKQQHKFATDKEYRFKALSEARRNREIEYWMKKLGVSNKE